MKISPKDITDSARKTIQQHKAAIAISKYMCRSSRELGNTSRVLLRNQPFSNQLLRK